MMFVAPHTIYTIALAICVFSTGLLGKAHVESNRRVSFVTLFLTIIAIQFLLEWLMIHPDTPLKALWLSLLMASGFWMGPILWLSAQELTHSKTRSQRLKPIDFAVVAIGALLTLPLLTSTHWGHVFPNLADPTPAGYSLFIHTTMLLCMILFLIQVPFYVQKCVKIVSEKTSVSEADPTDSRNSIPFILQLVCILTTVWALGLLRTFQCISGVPSTAIFTRWVAIVHVSVTIICLYAIFQKSLMRRNSKTLETAPQPNQMRLKYARSSIDSQIRERILRKLNKAMQEDELYRDSLLNLRSLCKEIGENTHFTSQVINQDLSTHFYGYVNAYRISQAKVDLQTHPQKTVLEVALDVGFNSKSTFHTAFRKIVGMTPTEFRATHTKA